MLPVPHLLAMVLAAAELDDAHLVVAAVAAHPGRDAGARHVRRAHGDGVAFADQQHLVEGDLAVRFHFLDAQDFACHHAVLATAGENDCVHAPDPRVLSLFCRSAAIAGGRTCNCSPDLAVRANTGRIRLAMLYFLVAGHWPCESSTPCFCSAATMFRTRSPPIWRPDCMLSCAILGISCTHFWPTGERKNWVNCWTSALVKWRW